MPGSSWREIPGSGDSADVLVIVKESWTLKLSGSLKEGNRLKVSLTEQNLLGLGHQVSGAVTLIPDATPRLGFDTNYSMQNIHGSFVTGRLEYAKMPGKETTGLGALPRARLSRPPLRRRVGPEADLDRSAGFTPFRGRQHVPI